MNKLFLTILFSFCFPVFAIECPSEYLQWDNSTPASLEDLLQDPLLILRTSERQIASKDAFPLAWRRIASCDYLHAADAEIPSLKQSDTLPLVCIQEKIQITVPSHFDHITPFFLCTPSDWKNIHWQISETPDFSHVISTLDVIDPYQATIYISDLAETFLNSGTSYFLRAQGISEGFCSLWTEPVGFTLEKPATPKNCTLNASIISWENVQDSKATYLIFGSNSMDFIPSVYSMDQIDAMQGNTVAATSLPCNFIGATEQTSWTLNDSYAYYRVVAQVKGHFSNPSALIYNHEVSTHQRDILQYTYKDLKTEEATAFRSLLPASYTGQFKYLHNSTIREEVWSLLEGYFLPENHSIKLVLDKIFSNHDVLSSKSAFKKAGFDLLKHPQNRMIIAKHSKLKGYLVKAFLDSEPNTEWEWWKKRIDGARVIQAGIDKHGFHAFMKVPKKWIYPLPTRKGSSQESSQKKQFVLIVENMNLQGSGEIRRSFKTKVTRELLDALYVIITENLLIDSIFADNIPFSKDGRIAFVDTEHFNDTTQPVRLWMLARYLSPEMHAYWDQVLFHGRPLTLSK